ncbi:MULTISPECIES: cytochrome P450 family protein [Actinokineospora]|uniref:Cytochrome P450 n=1 Tax=Actinokineospora fastidiosa TaxID=1816 RepID=A0A918GMX2_9PSEU|nr:MULTISPECIES: cytochrome P450 [Actinokineospora]UVS78674.1 Cytochrome P450 PerC [Actinokineospora sp. UTMC 2448]GGS46081.1 cytochrome P450 [Actinokineospora fastidiosa]
MDLTSKTYPFERKCPFAMPEEFAWIRANQPVARVKLASGDPAWLVTRYDDVRAALTDARFSRSINQEGAARVDTGFAADRSSPVFTFGGSISMPPGHTRWRRIVNKAFTQRQADAMRPRIAQHTEDVLDEIQARGGGFDLMADFAYQLPIRVIAELLGIDESGRPEFTELAAKLTRRDMQSGFAAFGEALQGIGRYAIGLIVRKRKDLGDDLLSTLIGLHDDDDTQLSNEELVSTVILLLMAGYESTAVQFGNGFYALFRNPEQLARLKANPALIGTAVEEILRWAQMGTGFAVAKFATEDIELGGVTIPSGSTVFVSLGSGNRDEAVFGADSEDFDIARAQAARQLAFGSGPHYCLGAALARAEMQEGFQRLFARFPDLRFDGDLDDVVLSSNLFTFYPRALPVLP